MSLQGTLETIPLPDVLALLAATKKTGELRITGPRGDGRLWLDAGQVVAADVPRAATPVDAVFELLRLTAGSFTFGTGAPPAAPGKPIGVDALLGEARQRLTAWQAIEAVVPSLACTLRLTPELGPESVTVSRKQWKELVAVAGGGDVNGAMRSLGIGEFDACRAVKELVDAGLVQVGKAPAAPPPTPEQRPAAPADRTEPAKAAPASPSRPAPTIGHVPARATSAGPAAPAAAPGRVPATAAPVAAANGGRSAAPRRGPVSVPDREEAEELVQQLAALGGASAKAPSGENRAPVAPVAGGKKGEVAAPPEGDDEGSAEGSGDEPINRGMLLKFLSSVRP